MSGRATRVQTQAKSPDSESDAADEHSDGPEGTETQAGPDSGDTGDCRWRAQVGMEQSSPPASPKMKDPSSSSHAFLRRATDAERQHTVANGRVS